MGGLITAAGMAIRFNRTLLIRSQNGFEKLFSPINSPQRSYAKDMWANWTNYNITNEILGDITEFDLWECAYNQVRWLSKCGFDDWSDPKDHPIIKLTSNRCYLCRWYMYPVWYPSHKELLKALLPDYNVTEDTSDPRVNDRYHVNLMEVAGCLMRLVMWPTDALWGYVHDAMEEHKKDLKRRGLVKHHDNENKWKRMITLHFRCGDHSYNNNKDSLLCVHSVARNVTKVINGTTVNELEYNYPPHQETSMMGGTPIDLAQCALKIIANNSLESHKETLLSNHGSKRSRRHLRTMDEASELETLIHIASDNIASTRQMNESLGDWPNTFLSPSGCHIEMDNSFECLRLTVTYFFIMSLSDNIITPTNDGLPSSGYSRFAGIYSLVQNVFKDGKNCDRSLSLYDIGRRHMGNWGCN